MELEHKQPEGQASEEFNGQAGVFWSWGLLERPRWPPARVAAKRPCRPRLRGTHAFRTLGRTGMKITIVSMGAMRTSGRHAIFQAAFDKGVNYIDTARGYMDGRNRGWWAKRSRLPRPRVRGRKVKPGSKEAMIGASTVIAGGLRGPAAVACARSAEQVMNTSTARCWPRPRKSGKTRFIGVTTHSKEPDVLNAVTDDPDKLYDTVLVTYNFQKPPEIKAAIAKAAAANAIIAMKTQAADIRPGIVS